MRIPLLGSGGYNLKAGRLVRDLESHSRIAAFLRNKQLASDPGSSLTVHNSNQRVQSIFQQNMAKNIRFHYLYRDSGNYKKFGHKDFSNPDQLPVEQVRLELEQHLIDRSFFYPEAVGIKKFRFHRFCDDYSWYELEKVEEVNSGKCKETIVEFIKRLENANLGF